MPPLPLRFVTSADRVEALPPTDAEVAVIGRSNVGKSSLLNALAQRKALAKVSKTPGRTQLLNCFALEGPGGGDGPVRTLVDCPGYGYAKVSAGTRAGWGPMIERYLREREALTMVAVLVDGAVGPTALDASMLAWLRAASLPHAVIATKADKVRAAGRPKRRRDLAAGCELAADDVLWVSAASGAGMDALRKAVLVWLGA